MSGHVAVPSGQAAVDTDAVEPQRKETGYCAWPGAAKLPTADDGTAAAADVTASSFSGSCRPTARDQ